MKAQTSDEIHYMLSSTLYNIDRGFSLDPKKNPGALAQTLDQLGLTETARQQFLDQIKQWMKAKDEELADFPLEGTLGDQHAWLRRRSQQWLYESIVRPAYPKGIPESLRFDPSNLHSPIRWQDVPLDHDDRRKLCTIAYKTSISLQSPVTQQGVEDRLIRYHDDAMGYANACCGFNCGQNCSNLVIPQMIVFLKQLDEIQITTITSSTKPPCLPAASAYPTEDGWPC
ncbi:MAG: hypothetical protein UW70_C0020G0014 [Candidatus Peregrinibacteria bacterium GW2011_GWA2_44_7]|nr:MAG: hypothetical protein UW70_C0020G0014 [Candidatus Peregrinibacteria bacterium GW2011_GWA2_44_7]